MVSQSFKSDVIVVVIKLIKLHLDNISPIAQCLTAVPFPLVLSQPLLQRFLSVVSYLSDCAKGFRSIFALIPAQMELKVKEIDAL